MNVLEKIDRNDMPLKIKETLELIEAKMGTVPVPITMLTASPGLFDVYLNSISYYSAHKNLSFEFLVFLRYLTSCKLGFASCMHFNGELLRKMGVTEQELTTLSSNIEKVPLSEKEKALMSAIIAGLSSQSCLAEETMKELKKLGWSEADIIDAANHAFSMMVPAAMLRFFSVPF